MKVKMVEIRDEGTRIAALAIKTQGETPQEGAFWYGTGFAKDTVLLIRPEDRQIEYSPYSWDSYYRTMRHAHLYILNHFDELPDTGAVIDVQVILGETVAPKTSEIWRGAV